MRGAALVQGPGLHRRASGWAGAPGHFPGHFAGIAVGHPGDEVDHPQESAVQRGMRVWGIVADQVQYPAALERRGAPAVLFECCATKGIEQNLQGGVGPDFVQGLALVLEDLVACHVLGLQHAALGRAVHVLHQVARQVPGQQCLLLLDERVGGGVGQVLDSFATQNRQLAPTGIARAELAVGFWQVFADQVKQQRFDFGVFQQLHFQAVFQVDQRIADVIGGLHQVHQRVARPALLFQLRHAQLAGDLLQQGQFATGNFATKLRDCYRSDLYRKNLNFRARWFNREPPADEQLKW